MTYTDVYDTIGAWAASPPSEHETTFSNFCTDMYSDMSLEDARSHPAILAIKDGCSMRQAQAKAAAAGQPMQLSRLQYTINRLRKEDGDEWLPERFLHRSRALRKAPAAPASSTPGCPLNPQPHDLANILQRLEALEALAHTHTPLTS